MSNGAISFYLGHYVRTRVAKVTYGTEEFVPYQASDVEHVKRLATAIPLADGVWRLPVFRTMLQKVRILIHNVNAVLISGRIPKFQKPKNSFTVWHGSFLSQRKRVVFLPPLCATEAIH